MTKKEERLRMEGLSFAVNFLEKNNNDVEALKAEAKRRGAYHIPLPITKSEENTFCEQVKDACASTITTMTLAVLHDTFGFGKKRAARFIKKFDEGAALLEANLAYWRDYQQGVKEELGIEVVFSDRVEMDGFKR